MFTTKKLIIIVGKQLVFILVAVGISAFFIFLISSQIDKVSNTAMINLQATNKMAARAEHITDITHDISIIGQNDALIDHAFLYSDNILEFISALENIALKNGVTESFHFETPTPADEASPFPLSIIGYQNTISENISSFSRDLKEFENLPFFTRIDSINFVAQDASGWEKGGTASYHAVLYTKTSN